MKAALRIAWTMTSLSVLLQAAVVTTLIVLMGGKNGKLFEGLMPIPLAIMLVFFARRIARVTDSGIWRYLPDGPHALVRGVGIVLLAATLWLGGLYAWAAPARFSPLPLGHLPAVWLPFTMLGFALLAGAGRRLPSTLPFLYVLVCVMAFGMMMHMHAHKPWMWIATSLGCAAAWGYAAFGKLPRGFAATVSPVGLRPAERAMTLANRTVFNLSPPANTLLRTGKGGGSLALSVLILVVFSVFQNGLLGSHPHADDYRVQSWMTLWASAFFVFVLGTPLAARSRRLWLRLGEARGGVFRVCERLLLRDALVLAASSWLVVVLLIVLRGLALTPGEAARLFVAYLGAALLPIYLSLGLSTVHSGWLKVPAAIVAVFGLAVWPFFWLRALGVTNVGFGVAEDEFSFTTFVILLGSAAALRWFALHRWNTIDWARFQPRRLA